MILGALHKAGLSQASLSHHILVPANEFGCTVYKL